jgi:Ribose/xylose/arabinose/galactoside ABC-type transport systems, permease components
VKKIKLTPPLIALLLAIALFILGGIIQPGFASVTLGINILRLAAFLAIMAAGQTLVIIGGGQGIDLSVGAVVTLGAILVFQITNGHDSLTLPALLVALAVGAVIGAVNGLGISYWKVPPLVMTLGMTSVVTGTLLVLTQGKLIGNVSPIMPILISKPLIFGIPGVVFFWIILGFLMWLLMERTNYGKQLFAIGTNRVAASLSGVNVAAISILTYSLSGLLAALGGFVIVSYTQHVYLNIGLAYTLPTIAAAVIGGTLMSGGSGTYFGTMAGALVLTLITSLLTTLQLPESARQVVYGLILLALLSVYGRQKALRQ